MVESTIRCTLPYCVQRVWEVVTAVEGYAAWRSDLSKAEVLDGTRFVEYTKGGYATAFTTTAWEPCSRWEFHMENSNMSGHWVGTFSGDGQGTQLCFTEVVSAKKWWMRPLVRRYLKGQQARFVADLRAALGSMG